MTPVRPPKKPAMPDPLDPASLSAEQLQVWHQAEHLWELSRQRDVSQIRDSLHADYVGWDTNAPRPHDCDAAVHSVTADTPRLLGSTLFPLSVQVYEGAVGIAHYRYRATVQTAHNEPLDVTGK